jgi:hypothetical protein
MAGAGFAFQDAHILTEIPNWLSKDGFTAVIREGLGDAETEFFDPSTGEKIILFEMKSSRLDRPSFWAEVQRFLELERTTKAFDRFELVTTGFVREVESVLKRLERLRRATPFYASALEIQDESIADFLDACVSSGGTEDQGRILLEKTAVNTAVADERIYLGRFQESLHSAFPETLSATRLQIEDSYNSLRGILLDHRGKRIRRQDLESRMWAPFPQEIRPSKDSVRLHFEHDESDSPNEDRPELILKWAEFFGGTKREFPTTEEWAAMVEQLIRTRDWILKNDRPKNLRLTGFRRLSASVAVGATFPEVGGFNLCTDAHGDVWCTSSPPPFSDQFGWTTHKWRFHESENVAVSVGLPRAISPDVEEYLRTREGPQIPHLAIHSGSRLSSEVETDEAGGAAKRLIAECIQSCKATEVHLFLAVPAPLALFLGHRLNALGTIQGYEFSHDGAYQPTCVLPGG